MKARDWNGFSYYAGYTPRQRRTLIRMDRGIIRLFKVLVVVALLGPVIHDLLH